jgi:hypothetical protein
LGFDPVAVVGKLVQKIRKRQLCTIGEIIYKTVQKQNTQIKNPNIKSDVKNISRLIGK